MRSIYLVAFLLFNQSAMAKFEAHEWGTFTSLVGSNGVTQNGMYHEDEKLPDFVHPFGVVESDLPRPTPPPRKPCHSKMCMDDDFFNRNVITQKMETPVIYFYSDRLRSVEVNVKFPEGVVTETYPAPATTSPTTGSIREAANGNTTFRLDVLNGTAGALPYVAPGNIYGHARAVNSNLVKSLVSGEQEKFIFYRGIGRFQPNFGIYSSGGALGLDFAETEIPGAIFLVDVDEKGHGQLMRVPTVFRQANVTPKQMEALRNHLNGVELSEGRVSTGEVSRERLVSSLTGAGLNVDEAYAMINTWENGYLKVPGLRLLYILPRTEVDQVLPLTISPAPEKLERVFVGRIEVLLDTEEQAILGKITKEREFFKLSSLGRFAEPKLRRIREVYVDTETKRNRTPRLDLLRFIDELIQQAAKDSGV